MKATGGVPVSISLQVSHNNECAGHREQVKQTLHICAATDENKNKPQIPDHLDYSDLSLTRRNVSSLKVLIIQDVLSNRAARFF